jgi:WD40 repeat protein
VVVSETTILVFNYATYEKVCEWRFDDVKLTSVEISQDSRHMLLSMSPNKIRLMEIDTGETVQNFEGHQQSQYIIRSNFGGANENFVVSGSDGMFSLNPF